MGRRVFTSITLLYYCSPRWSHQTSLETDMIHERAKFEIRSVNSMSYSTDSVMRNSCLSASADAATIVAAAPQQASVNASTTQLAHIASAA